MEKKLIVRIAEGLGNQLFMYANAYSLSKKIDYTLYVDDLSGFIKTKNFRSYYLNNFNISAKTINNKYKFDSFSKNVKRKILKKIDLFSIKKKFIIEKVSKNKICKFDLINTNSLDDLVYIEGHYESEKYFLDYRHNLLNEFRFNVNIDLSNNFYYELIKKNHNNIVSICVRTNRFSERPGNENKDASIIKSENYVKDTIDYINRGIEFIKSKIKNPIFLIWSNDFTNLKNFFPDNNYIFVENQKNKIITDFYLLQNCKNFIVGPTSFHWWGAWLSKYDDKICIYPKNINPSNNINFWPNNWIAI